MVSLDKKPAIDMCVKSSRLISKGRQVNQIKLYRNSLLLTSLCWFILPMNGCGYADKPPSHFVKIPDRPNAFRMYVINPFFQPRDRICGVRVTVYHSHSDLPEVCWEIKANEPVDAAGFEIVVGQVPEGFQQVIPNSGQRFDPVPGRHYDIEVDLEHPLALPWMETPWVAD